MRIGRDVATSSMVISLCGLIGQTAAFATTFLLARFFGASSDVDAFAATMAVPYFVVAIVQASVNKAFLPVFVGEMGAGREREAWRTATGTAAALALVLAVLAAASVPFHRALAAGLFPGFGATTGETAANLARITLPACLPLGLATHLASLHMARRRFLVASLSQALQPIGGLVGLLLLRSHHGILALPLGILAGSTLQAVLLGIPLVGRTLVHGIARRGEEAFRTLGGRLAPLLVAAIFAKAFQLLEKRFGAQLPEGTLSHMAYGWKLVAFLFFLVSNGVILSSFTYLSETAATGDRAELRRRTAAITRGMLLVLLPILTAAFVLRVEAMSLFERGAFGRDDSLRAATALSMYLPLLLVFSLNGVASQVFYALGRVRSVAIVSAGSLAVYVLAAPRLMAAFGMPGLISTYLLAILTGYVAYVALLRPLIGGIEGRKLLVTAVRALLAAAAAAGCLEMVRRLVRDHLLETPLLVRAALLAALGAITILPYAGLVWIMGDRELPAVIRSLREGRRGRKEP